MSTVWTADHLAKLDAAIAKGVQRVSYADQDVTYRSLDEMLRLRDRMRAEIAGTSGIVNPSIVYAGRRR